MRKASNLHHAWLDLVFSTFFPRKVADMPKLFLSDDPLAAATLDKLDYYDARGRRPNPILPILLIPALGLALMAVGIQVRPSASAPTGGILAADVTEKPGHCEAKAEHLAEIETARRNVLHWQHENCCGAATPHSLAKMRMWQHGYQQRLAVFARIYRGQICQKQRKL